MLLAATALLGVAGTTRGEALRGSLQQDLDQYLHARSSVEHVTAISLSISLHGAPANINITAGSTRIQDGAPVASDSLWQIGSNTKAFTAAIILQLEAEGKLTIDQTVGRWLPQYPAWKRVTIRQLLNMTSGIPSYDHVPAMLQDYAKEPRRNFTVAELIAYVYPGNAHAPPPTTGWSYSNTNYLLAELIIERAGHDSYTNQLEQRFLQSNIGLTSSYYAADRYAAAILSRMVPGYFFSRVDDAPLAPLFGRDVRDYSVSWMRAAGGIVSTPEDLTRWARALYAGPILAPKQRTELMSIVSLKTGHPIAKTTLQDSGGFGLGVGQTTTAQMGTVWSYEGSTFGYRVLHFYFPRQDAVIAFGLNSDPDHKEDHAGKLALSLYETLHKAGQL
ncbi:MAG TPA: serine hydrolase domain-containing protein [Candidatus Tumulicola sp.]|jgi:D-alanyl-D-alanine carboxypeptidase